MATAIIGTALGGGLAWCFAMLFERLKSYGEEQRIVRGKRRE